MQFIRHTCLRKWLGERGSGDQALQASGSQLAKDVPFAALLNSQARQTSADRAWLSIARFYTHGREKQPDKKGSPRFQPANRSVEYKATGCLEPATAFQEPQAGDPTPGERVSEGPKAAERRCREARQVRFASPAAW